MEDTFNSLEKLELDRKEENLKISKMSDEEFEEYVNKLNQEADLIMQKYGLDKK